MRTRRFLRMIQCRAARAAIGPSATRGQGAPGVVAQAREFLAAIQLSQFGTGNRAVFCRRLDAATHQLEAALPRSASTWGLSRKLMNLFLRDCLYTSFLARANGLGKAEHLLEIPLDSITARSIRQDHPHLPRWPGVKYLDADLSAAYQAAAASSATRHRVARVHMDAYWWGAR